MSLMIQGTSFKKILHDKLMADAESLDFNTPIDQDPANLAFLMGRVPKFKFSHSAPKAYSKQKPRTAATASEPPTPPSHWSCEQKQAFSTLLELGIKLEFSFSNLELKRAFRQLALKLHPDQGGNETCYLKMRLAILQLQTLATA